MNRSVVHHVGDRNKVYLSHIFPETKATLLLLGFKRGGGNQAAPHSGAIKVTQTHVGRTEAVPRHWLLSRTVILAVVDMLRRGDKQVCHGVVIVKGLGHLQRFAQALQPLFDLSHTSRQNAV